jgi:hypothetical protein
MSAEELKEQLESVIKRYGNIQVLVHKPGDCTLQDIACASVMEIEGNNFLIIKPKDK